MASPNEYLDSLFNLKLKGPSVQNRTTCVLAFNETNLKHCITNCRLNLYAGPAYSTAGERG